MSPGSRWRDNENEQKYTFSAILIITQFQTKRVAN